MLADSMVCTWYMLADSPMRSQGVRLELTSYASTPGAASPTVARTCERRNYKSVCRRELEMKRAAVAKTRPIGRVTPAVAAWRTNTTILQWLEAL